MKSVTSSLIFLVGSVAVCQCAASRKITGPKRNLANVGFLQTYMIVDDDDRIMELGVELDQELMEIELMPTEASDGKNDIVDPETGETVWFLPSTAFPCHAVAHITSQEMGRVTQCQASW